MKLKKYEVTSNMLKVLGVSGSPRKSGNTDILLDIALQSCSDISVSNNHLSVAREIYIEKIFISDLKISPCRECNSCFDTGKCIIQDDMQMIYPKLTKFNRFIFASPIFFMGITAQLKAMIDRCQVLWAKKNILKLPLFDTPPIEGRKGIFISAGGTKGEKLFVGALMVIKNLFKVLEIDFIESDTLLFRNVDAKGAILSHSTAINNVKKICRFLIDYNLR